MTKKRIIIIISVVVSLLIAVSVISLVVLLGKKSAPSRTNPDASTTPPATTTAPPGDNDKQVLDQRNAEVASNPLLSKLPHDTAYWSVSYGGVRDSKYVITATVYVHPGQDGTATVSKQKPFIESYLSSSGQTAGTYLVDYATSQVQSD